MEIKEKIKLQQWAEEIAQQQSSGLSHKQWCHIHNIPVSTFEYHCRRVRAAIQKMSGKNNAANMQLRLHHFPNRHSPKLS